MTEIASHGRRWWTIKEAAAHIEVHTDTMYKYAKRALRRYAKKKTGMPVVRHNGRQYKFPVEEFKAWAEHPTD